MSLLSDDFRRNLHILQADIIRRGDADNHTVRAVDGGFQQRAGNCRIRSGFRFILPTGMANAHMRMARIFHNSGNIRKIQVDEARHLNQLRDAFHTLKQHAIRFVKRVCKRDLFVGNVF